MTDSDYINNLLDIVDSIDYAVVADTDPPKVGLSLKFTHPSGRGARARASMRLRIREIRGALRRSSSFRAERANTMLYSAMYAASVTSREPPLHTFQ